MSAIVTEDGTEIHYTDWGDGQPIVLSHGWPLSADAFEDEMFFWRRTDRADRHAAMLSSKLMRRRCRERSSANRHARRAASRRAF